MGSKKKILFALLSGIVITFGLLIWTQSSPSVQDYYLIHDRDTEFDIAFAFAVSLRNNDPAAYEVIDPKLKSRLDDWMTVHQGKKCTKRADTVFLGKGTKQGYIVILDCFSEHKWLSFTVDNIVIVDMKVANWGEVEEE